MTTADEPATENNNSRNERGRCFSPLGVEILLITEMVGDQPLLRERTEITMTEIGVQTPIRVLMIGIIMAMAIGETITMATMPRGGSKMIGPLGPILVGKTMEIFDQTVDSSTTGMIIEEETKITKTSEETNPDVLFAELRLSYLVSPEWERASTF